MVSTRNIGHGFLLVFSITSLNSLLELSELRDQIIRIKDDVKTPIVIVGNKSDLEEDRAVSRARAFSVSQSWGNSPYYETSARRRTNVDEVFRDLCRQIILHDPSMVMTSPVGSSYRDDALLGESPYRIGTGGTNHHLIGGGLGKNNSGNPTYAGAGAGAGAGTNGSRGIRGRQRNSGRKGRRRRDDRICTIL